MSNLKTQLNALDENYILNIANKGLLNRAKKELENTNIIINGDMNEGTPATDKATNAEVTLSISDTIFTASFSDGTTVSIQDSPSNFACSCPSRSICKHVVVALLAAMQTINSIEVSHTPSQPNATLTTPLSTDTSTAAASFDYLLEHTQESLIKEYSKKLYNNALNKVLSGQTCDITHQQKLSISMMEGAITVTLLPGDSLDNAICTCKTNPCQHRLEALFHYIHVKTGKLSFTPTETKVSVDLSIIPHALSFVEDIYRIGLFRLPPDYAGLCSQYASLCHGAGFAALERHFEACSNELSLYESKNAGFNIANFSKRLAAAYQILYNLKNRIDATTQNTLNQNTSNQNTSNQDIASLVGRFKQQYTALPKIKIFGIGAYPWYAKSGFCGVSAVFFCPELKKTLSFAISRPAESESKALKAIERFWGDRSTWDINVTLDELARGEYALIGAKISTSERLSSSEETKGSIISPHTNLDDPALAELVIDNFSKLKNLFTHEEVEFNSVYAIVKPATIGQGSFNRVAQEYTLPLFDKHENILHLVVKYSKINEGILVQLEELAQKQAIPDGITVNISISQERWGVIVTPIAIWAGNTIKNLGKDFGKDKKKQSYFARFFASTPCAAP